MGIVFLLTWDEVKVLFLFKMFALRESQHAIDTKPNGKMEKINRKVLQKKIPSEWSELRVNFLGPFRCFIEIEKSGRLRLCIWATNIRITIKLCDLERSKNNLNILWSESQYSRKIVNEFFMDSNECKKESLYVQNVLRASEHGVLHIYYGFECFL